MAWLCTAVWIMSLPNFDGVDTRRRTSPNNGSWPHRTSLGFGSGNFRTGDCIARFRAAPRSYRGARLASQLDSKPSTLETARGDDPLRRLTARGTAAVRNHIGSLPCDILQFLPIARRQSAVLRARFIRRSVRPARSSSRQLDDKAINVLSAFASHIGAVIGDFVVRRNMNEISASLVLLKELPLDGDHHWRCQLHTACEMPAYQ